MNKKGSIFGLIILTGSIYNISETKIAKISNLNLSKICKHVFIEEIPLFDEFNSNQQLRFITLIDIFYEKKISLTISLNCSLEKLGTSKKHSKIFKRSLSRLYEMTLSKKY